MKKDKDRVELMPLVLVEEPFTALVESDLS